LKGLVGQNHKDKSCEDPSVHRDSRILTFPFGSPALYPGDCIQTPGGPVATARIVQALSYDPPRFEIEFEACKVTSIARENNEGAAEHNSTTPEPQR
jgi:hypothetical protein